MFILILSVLTILDMVTTCWSGLHIFFGIFHPSRCLIMLSPNMMTKFALQMILRCQDDFCLFVCCSKCFWVFCFLGGTEITWSSFLRLFFFWNTVIAGDNRSISLNVIWEREGFIIVDRMSLYYGVSLLLALMLRDFISFLGDLINLKISCFPFVIFCYFKVSIYAIAMIRYF